MSDGVAMQSVTANARVDAAALARRIKTWGWELGFDDVAIADTDLAAEETQLMAWLGLGYHGEMDYMARHGSARSRPAELIPGTLRVIAARLNYLAEDARDSWDVLDDPRAAFVSRYALGRDYHKVLRGRLQDLATRIAAQAPGYRTRVFTDSAPVMEVALARKAGLGWRGKHTLLLNRAAGSMFFLGEIYTDLPLPVDEAVGEHCGSCTRCIDICPTHAIVAPYRLDARRCISYLTIEHRGPIPVEFREAMGNRIYGCDDCQLTCPWNKYARTSPLPDFAVRNGLDGATLLGLWSWRETEWLERMAGSAIRRIGYERWRRNLAVAIGNALRNHHSRLAPAETESLRAALRQARAEATPLVAEHIDWALVEPQPA